MSAKAARQNQVIGTELTEADLRKLESSSWITPDLAVRAMLRRVTSQEGGAIVGRNGTGDYSGILFPYIWPGEPHVRDYRLRRDNPDIEFDRNQRPREKNKYLSSPGRTPMLYFVPGTPVETLADTSIPVMLAEGEKKTLALWRLGLYRASKLSFLPVGLSGVWNWKGRIGKVPRPNGGQRDAKGPIPDLSRIPWDGRRTVLIFDADVQENDSVAAARSELSRELLARGADVFLAELPVIGSGKGIDDLLVHCGPLRVLELLEKAQRAKPPEDAGTKEIADAICGTDYFAQDGGGRLYRYCHGVYKPDGAAHVKRRVKDLLERWKLSHKWSSHRAEEVIEYIRVDSPPLWEKPPADIINVQNGLLHVGWQTMRELRPHTPDHLSSVQLPVVFDRSATCPMTEKFVSEIFPEDAQKVPWQIFALMMTPGPSFQKAVLLIGSGGNGKSTFLAQLAAFIGRANHSNVSLHKIESDKFSGARLIGKLANICPDLPSEHLSGTSIFKAITGGDPISAEYKFKDGFDFMPFCRLVFSANTPPRSQDNSEGFFDRWLVIPFNRGFRGTRDEIPRGVLDRMLSDPKELSGVLNNALDAFPAVAVNGISETDSMKDAWNEFRIATDHLAVWLDRSTIELPNALTPKNALRIAYNAQRERDGLPTMTAAAIGRALKKLRPKLDESQRTTYPGKVEWVYLGIALKPLDETGNSDEPNDGRTRDSRDPRVLPFLNLSRETDE